ncbi:hypothetical protein PV08_00267 [Exophiala spinifera]|uniref:non-specific serine/threonine protein kinase n=1 Tax=Exophiala spinifera TaxID=91928 RepID=A0A0D2BL57_9EURO|nr:uncharacterized protein PV08_00267 [Exophiala spinifera]KIW19693.1 hypothetical protein PV08_00267 [Exophiala spinifera]
MDLSQPFEEERLPWYDAAQFYPVRIGELFDSKYKVVGKLGYGAYSTVWLCRDVRDSGFVALKVCTREVATSPRVHRELRFYEHVGSLNSRHDGQAYIRGLLETFTIPGPAGRHLCLVQPPMHMTVRELQRLNSSHRLDEKILKWTLFNVLSALSFLHDEAKVAHTDISPSNIMLTIADESILEDFEKGEIEEPSPCKVIDDVRRVYGSRRLGFPRDAVWGQPVLCDFGEARIGGPHRGLLQPEVYRAPEVLFNMQWSSSVDIWNIAVLIWDLFENEHLFRALDENGESSATHHVAEMVGYLGLPPLEYIQRSEVTSKVFDEEGHWKRAGGVDVPLLSLESSEKGLKGEDKALFLRFGHDPSYQLARLVYLLSAGDDDDTEIYTSTKPYIHVQAVQVKVMASRDDKSSLRDEHDPEKRAHEELSRHYHSQSASASIKITRRTDLSLLYRIVRTLIRPVRPKLVKLHGETPAGSQRLSAPRRRGCEVIETQREGVWEYTFRHVEASRVQKRNQDQNQNQNQIRSSRSPQSDSNHADDDSDNDSDHDTPVVNTSDAATSSTPLTAATSLAGTGTKPKTRKHIHRIYYFSGGGFQSPPSPGHWMFLSKLAKSLQLFSASGSSSASSSATPVSDGTDSTEFQVTLVSQPLAPASPAPDALPVLRRWVTSVLDEASRHSSNSARRDGADSTDTTTAVTVTLAGDSSGGNVALSLGMWAAQELPPEQVRHVLSSILVVSPAVDLRNVNEEIKEADRYDPVLTIGLTGDVARAWAGGVGSKKRSDPKPVPTRTTTATAITRATTETNSETSGLGASTRRTGLRKTMSTSDWSVSPLLQADAVFEKLRDSGVRVHGVVGTHDVLAPDALEMMRKCDRFGVPGEWLVWEGQMHCFPLAGVGDVVGLREGKEGRRWIENVLKNGM